MLTPSELLLMDEFPDAKMITPEICGSFDSLLPYKEDIRLLKLLPIKTDEMRAQYLADRGHLLGNLITMMGGKNVMYMINDYPYFLPKDINQGIIWIADDTKDDEVISFIDVFLKKNEVDPSKAISFERSMTAKTKLVRGTFKSMRHIHMWTQK